MTPEERANAVWIQIMGGNPFDPADGVDPLGAVAHIATAIREAVNDAVCGIKPPCTVKFTERGIELGDCKHRNDLAIREARNAALEEAAKICAEQSAIFSCDTYAVDQPLSSIGERFACGQIKEAILALKDKPE